METQQSEAVTNNCFYQTTKSELAQYLKAELFSQKTASLLKGIKQCILNTWPGLTENNRTPAHEKTRTAINQR